MKTLILAYFTVFTVYLADCTYVLVRSVCFPPTHARHEYDTSKAVVPPIVLASTFDVPVDYRLASGTRTPVYGRYGNLTRSVTVEFGQSGQGRANFSTVSPLTKWFYVVCIRIINFVLFSFITEISY